MRIAIASAERLRIEALRRVVASLPGHAVSWIAQDGPGAVSLCASEPPNLLLLELELPGFGCVEVTRRVMSGSPCAILLISRDRMDASRPADVRDAFDAIGLGALDVVAAPRLGADGALAGAVAVADKIRTLQSLLVDKPRPAPPPAPAPDSRPPRAVVVAIGAASGGPRQLRTLLLGIPRDLPVALLILQHIEPVYAGGLASWLREQTGFPVELAEPGASPRPGVALLIAAGLGFDEFFRGLASHPRPGIAVQLGANGREGAEGLLRLHRAGWLTIGQKEPSSVLPLEAIAPTIVAAVTRPTRLP